MTARFRRACLAGLGMIPFALAGCDGEQKDARDYRVVCHSGGTKTHDDFSSSTPHLAEGGIYYRSRTTHSRVRVTGDCSAYQAERPEGWKPLFAS